MLLIGSPPYLECSSRGDTRFSPFFARPLSLNGRSIEEAYQGMKIFRDGSTGLSWRRAKGRKPVNTQECHSAYRRWWREWVMEQNLLPVLLSWRGLSDLFGQDGGICQAQVLWEIREKALRGEMGPK